MHVGLFTTVFPPQVGGMERFAEDLARGLTGAGHTVTVVGPGAPEGHAQVDAALPFRVVRAASAREQLEALRGVDVVHVNGNSLRGVGLAQLARRPVLVTHTSWQALCPTGMAWSELGPCSATARSPGPCAACLHKGLRHAAATRAHRAVPSRAHANVAVSAFMAGRLGLPRTVVVYNPVGDRAFERRTPGPGTPDTVAFAGRLVPEKGVDQLIRALVHLPSARLELVGDGPLRGQLEALALALGVNARIRWHGALPFEGLASVYARAAVVCIPSAWDEPFGYVVAEAMAMERPVVATRSGAFTELLEDGRGWLADRGDPRALADALGQALASPDDRAGRASRARAHAMRSFRMQDLVARYVDVYRSAVR